MKKIILLLAIVLFTQSCGSLAAGVINRAIIDTDRDELITNSLKGIEKLNLNEEQSKLTTSIYTESTDYIIENAKKEKRKEISNKTSLINVQYSMFKRQTKLEKILTKEQLLHYHQLISENKISGSNEVEMRKLKNKFKKRGYDVVL